MKKLLFVSVLALSLNALAYEEVELSGRAIVSNYTYHSKTTCDYGPTSFEIDAQELKDVSVYTKFKSAELWEKVGHSYKIEDGKTVVVVPKQFFDQVNNRSCAKLQVQLVK